MWCSLPTSILSVSKNMTRRLFLFVFGSNYDRHVLFPGNGTSGGITMPWKGTVCQAVASLVQVWYLITCNPCGFLFTFSAFHWTRRLHWWFTSVFGLQEDDEKLLFLKELQNVCDFSPGSDNWLVAGDFSIIYQAADKNDTNLNHAIMERFRCFLDDTNIKKVPLFPEKQNKTRYLSWAVNTLGSVRKLRQLLFGSTGFSAALIRGTFSLTLCCKARP